MEEESSPSTPDQRFKIVFVGNSAVGKTSLLRRLCEAHFAPGIAATVGIDYRVKTVNVDGSQVALQLWDTAGQERYRCITQQFFRKVDGVIIVYDLTAKESFLSVRQWLSSTEASFSLTRPTEGKQMAWSACVREEKHRQQKPQVKLGSCGRPCSCSSTGQ